MSLASHFGDFTTKGISAEQGVQVRSSIAMVITFLGSCICGMACRTYIKVRCAANQMFV